MKKQNSLFNPFANSELQKTMEHISKLEKEYVKIAFSSDAFFRPFADLQESIVSSYQKMFRSCFQIAEISAVTRIDELSDKITASIYEILKESIENSSSFQSLNLDLSDLQPKLLNIPTPPAVSDNLTDAGFVVLDASGIENYDLPESVAVTLSPDRKKMTAIDFIKLILVVLGALSNIHSLLPSAPSDTEIKSLQMQEAQNALLETGNQILSDLFRDIDLSMSNVSDSLQSLKETVEEQNSDISALKEAVRSLQQSSDNTKESLNTVPED